MPVELFSSPVKKLAQKLIDLLITKSDHYVVEGRTWANADPQRRDRLIMRAGIYRDLADMIREAADLDKPDEG